MKSAIHHPISQAEMQTTFFPILRRDGQLYAKYRNVFASVAKGGEHVVTVTSKGEETENTARPGDYIVENQTQAREQYILAKDIFEKRYEYIFDLRTGRREYKPIGKVIAIQLNAALLIELSLPVEIRFEAPWGETEVAYIDDFIVTLEDFSEVYRIGRREFEETYIISNRSK